MTGRSNVRNAMAEAYEPALDGGEHERSPPPPHTVRGRRADIVIVDEFADDALHDLVEARDRLERLLTSLPQRLAVSAGLAAAAGMLAGIAFGAWLL